MNIISFSSSGGNTINKESLQDTMYLVSQGDIINFTIVTDSIATIEWSNNHKIIKTTTNSTSDTYNYIVPNTKANYSIVARTYDINGESYIKWVISTIPTTEAPEICEYFVDGTISGARQTDPWGRALPSWSTISGSFDFSKKFLSGTTSGMIQTNTATAYGTFSFWTRYPRFTQCTVHATYFKYFYYTNGKAGFLYSTHPTADSHDYNQAYPYITPYDGGFKRYDRNSLAQAPAYNCIEDNQWHKITLIHTLDNFWYLFYDDELEPEKLSHDEVADTGRYMQYSVNNTEIDDIEIYNNQFIFPGTGRIEYGQYVSNWSWVQGGFDKNVQYWVNPILRTGISIFGHYNRLQDIYYKISNPALFSYDGIINGKNTYTCHTDLVIRQGAELIIDNEKLQFDNSNQGEHIFRVKLGATLNILNSIIDTVNDNYFIWAFTSHPITDLMSEDLMVSKIGPNSSLCEGLNNNSSTARNISNMRLIIKDSIINNSGNFWINSPKELIIENVQFTNLVQVNFGDYNTMTRDPKNRQYPKEKTNFAKSFGTMIQMDIESYKLENIKFSAKQSQVLPIDIVFMGGLDVLGENYIRNVTLENARIISKVGWKNDAHEGMINHDINSVTSIVNPNTPTTYVPSTQKEELLDLYYLDVKVVDINGNPINNATIEIENEISYDEPPQNIRSMRLPMYTADAAGTYVGAPRQLSEGGYFDRQIDIRRMKHPKTLIEYLKIGKDDDSFGLIYEIISNETPDVLINGVKNPVYDSNNRLISFEYFILNNVKSGDYCYYNINNIQYDINGLITSYEKYGYGAKEAGRDPTLGYYKYSIFYNYDINNILKNYTITRTTNGSSSEFSNNGWTTIRSINCSTATGIDGYTPLPLDRSNTIIIADKKLTNSSIIKYSYKITVTNGTKTISLTGFQIDESWYRPQENTPLKTLVANIDTGQFYISSTITGTISGNVKDTFGSNLSNATVLITILGTSTTTDANGNYSMNGVPVGTYDITASLVGYDSATKQAVIIQNTNTVIDFILNYQCVAPEITFIIQPQV